MPVACYSRILGGIAAILGFGLSPGAVVHAQEAGWPSKPITLIAPFAPGGSADLSARFVGNRLAQALGQPVVVENISGMGGAIAMRRLVRAAPDGYTLAYGHIGTLAMTPHIYADVGYDPRKDFTAIAQVGQYENVLVVGAGSPYKSVAELLAAARRQPGRMTYGSAGNGTSNHLAAALLSSMAGVPLTHVPYKGSAPALLGVMTGNVDFMFDVMATSGPLIDTGKLRALATTGPRRSPATRNLPAMAETLPGFEVTGWSAIVAPAGLPAAITQRLTTELEKILASPEGVERFRSLNQAPAYGGPRVVDAQIRQDLDRWGKIIQAAGVKLE